MGGIEELQMNREDAERRNRSTDVFNFAEPCTYCHRKRYERACWNASSWWSDESLNKVFTILQKREKLRCLIRWYLILKTHSL